MCCIRIQVLFEDTSNLPLWLLDLNGNVYLDLKDGFTLPNSKSASELSELDSITIDYTVGSTIPATRKNNAILQAYQFDNNFKTDYKKPLSIAIHSPLYNAIQNTLQVLSYDEDAKEYEIDIFNTSENWAYRLKNLKLRSIALPSFTFTKANITSNWSKNTYQDNTLPYYFGLVDYGSEEKTGIARNNFKLSDFRPLYSPLHLLRLACCEIGYKFFCPALETETMRRYWIYILNVEFWSYANKGVAYQSSSISRFNVNTALTGLIGTDSYHYKSSANEKENCIDFTVTTDPNGRIQAKTVVVNTINETANCYVNNSGFEQLIKFSTRNTIVKNLFTNSTAIATGVFEFEFIYMRHNSADNSISKFATSFFIDSSTTYSIENTFISEVNLKPNDYVALFVNLVTEIPAANDITFNISNGTTSTTSSEKGISLGDTVAMNQLIEENITGLDLLKGITHILQGRLIVDEISKSITIYTPSDVKFYAESTEIQGYLYGVDKAIDYTSKQVCKTWRREYKTEFDNRYIEIGFKESTDGYIESIKSRFNGIPPLGVKIDLGADKELNEETTKNLNPFFEASAMRDQNATTYGGGVYCPVVYDNTEGNLSYNIAPRIFYAAGLLQFNFNLENENRPTAPIMLTKPEFAFFEPLLMPNASYADSRDYKGWSYYFWQRKIASYSNVLNETIKVRMSNEDFYNLSFRNLLSLQSETAVNFYEVKGTSEFDPCLDTNEIELTVQIFDEPIINC